MTNLYEMLGVSPSASTDDIKRAYRRQAVRWYPDRNPERRGDAELCFEVIGYAISVLADPIKRQRYDELAIRRTTGFDPGLSELTADHAVEAFLAPVLDLAFQMALHDDDKITIYRALVADGCPERIAQAVTSRVHEMANGHRASTDIGKSHGGAKESFNVPSPKPPERRSQEGQKPRKAGPWPRFWARTLDILLMSPGALVLLPLMLEAAGPGSSKLAFGVVAVSVVAATLLIPFLLDACVVSFFGNSLGKALLGITVRRKDGRQLEFSATLIRNLHVWWYGFWTGLIPLLSWIPMLMAYRDLTGEKGETKWDADLGYDVHRTPVGAARIVAFVLSFMVAVLVANLAEMVTTQVLSHLAGAVDTHGSREVNESQTAFTYLDEADRVGTSSAPLPPGPELVFRYEDQAAAYLQDAQGGGAKAQRWAGRMYFTGFGAIPQDFGKAFDWYQKAAIQGNAKAQLDLGLMYFNGQGVRRDNILAYAWVNLAAASSVERASSYRAVVAQGMTAAEIAEGQRLASAWRVGKNLAR